MFSGSRFEIDSCAPCLIQRVRGGAYHSWQGLNRIKLAEICLWQASLDYSPERLFIDQLGESARETGCKLFERHDLETVIAFARSSEPEFSDGLPTKDNNSISRRLGHASA
jgi:hypothetical protein